MFNQFYIFSLSAVGVGGTLSYQFRSIVYCSNDSIVEFISSSPFMVNKSDIYQVSNGTWVSPLLGLQLAVKLVRIRISERFPSHFLYDRPPTILYGSCG